MKVKILALLAVFCLSNTAQLACTLPPDAIKELKNLDDSQYLLNTQPKQVSNFQTRYENILKKYNLKGYEASFFKNPFFPRLPTITVAGGSRDAIHPQQSPNQFDKAQKQTEQSLTLAPTTGQVSTKAKNEIIGESQKPAQIQVFNQQAGQIVQRKPESQPITLSMVIVQKNQEAQNGSPRKQTEAIPVQNEVQSSQPLPEPTPEDVVEPQIAEKQSTTPIYIKQQINPSISKPQKKDTINPLDAISTSPDVSVTTTRNGVVLIGQSGSAQGASVVSKPGGKAVGAGGVVIASNGRKVNNRYSAENGSFSAAQNTFIATIPPPPQPEFLLKSIRKV